MEEIQRSFSALYGRLIYKSLGCQKYAHYAKEVLKVEQKVRERQTCGDKAKVEDELAKLATRLCALASQIDEPVITFEMQLVAADILFRLCDRYKQASGMILQAAAQTIRNEDKGRASLLMGKVSDLFESQKLYKKAADAEQISLDWAIESKSIGHFMLYKRRRRISVLKSKSQQILLYFFAQLSFFGQRRGEEGT